MFELESLFELSLCSHIWIPHACPTHDCNLFASIYFFRSAWHITLFVLRDYLIVYFFFLVNLLPIDVQEQQLNANDAKDIYGTVDLVLFPPSPSISPAKNI